MSCTLVSPSRLWSADGPATCVTRSVVSAFVPVASAPALDAIRFTLAIDGLGSQRSVCEPA